MNHVCHDNTRSIKSHFLQMKSLVHALALWAFFFGLGTTNHLPKPDGNLNIYAIPVGQGDCTVIQCPHELGGKISIIDIGSTSKIGFNREKVANYLSGETIENIILTHADKDHINYLSAILKPLAPSAYPKIYHSCKWKSYKDKVGDRMDIETNPIVNCCGKQCEVKNAHLKLPLKICDEHVTLRVLASGLMECKGKNEASNGDSVVTQVDYNGIKTLISGDFEGDEKFIKGFLDCDGVANSIQSYIYRLAHHGSQNANSEKYLSAVNPNYVFSSSGFYQGYRHPRCSVYQYFSGLSDTRVEHSYTCYDSSYNSYRDHKTTKAIYTTSTSTNSWPNIEDGSVTNHVIKFTIQSNGKIKSQIESSHKQPTRDEL